MDGDFEKAKMICENKNREILEHDINVIAYDTGSVASYFFILHLLFLKEEAQLHYIACSLLINPLVDIPGAYYLAYNHILKALQLDSNNLKYKENLLLFYHIPDKLLGREKAVEIANSILKYCPDNIAAKSIL